MLLVATLLLLQACRISAFQVPFAFNADVGFAYNVNTYCPFLVKSSGTSDSSESFNGDLAFLTGSDELLEIGLHPEARGGTIAVKNSVFDATSSAPAQYGYRWVSVDYPSASSGMERTYSFDFTDTDLVIKAQDQLLLIIPYTQLDAEPSTFRSRVDTVRFLTKDMRWEFENSCKDLDEQPALILCDGLNQIGPCVTIHGSQGLIPAGFGGRTTSLWAVRGDWELYTGSNYWGTRFVINDGQKMNAKHNNQYKSARLMNCNYISDPETALVKVSTSSYHQNGKEFTTPQPQLDSEFNDRISSIMAVKGDWEFFWNSGYDGYRMMVIEGQQKDVLGNYDNKISSFRPICENYKGKERCNIKKIEIKDADTVEPQYTGTEIIGSQSSGSCYGPAEHEIEISQANAVEEAVAIEISRDSEVNWEMSTAFSLESEVGFLGTGVTVGMEVSASVGGAMSFGSSETKETVNVNEKSHGQVTQFPVPGAGIVFGVVDRYEIDKSNIPVVMHLECPGGRNTTRNSSINLKTTSFGAAHFWSLTGEFTREACRADRNLPDCVEAVRRDYSTYVGSKEKIEEAFEKCFEGKGTFDRK